MEKIKAAPIVPKEPKLPVTPTVTQDTSKLDEAFVGVGQTPGMDKLFSRVRSFFLTCIPVWSAFFAAGLLTTKNTKMLRADPLVLGKCLGTPISRGGSTKYP